jgi:asparagine synthase (glutamine-hydrolysing)
LGIKRILIDIARPLLPTGFDLRPKRGFAMPFDSWLRGPLGDAMQDTLSDVSIGNRGWLDKKAATGVRNEFLAGRSNWARPWLMMMLELWARQVLDRGAG